MPPVFIAAVAFVGASAGGLVGAALIMGATTIGTALFYITVIGGSIAYANSKKRKAEQAAKDAYNAGLQDRLTMVTQADGARSRVYGRVRNVDGILFHATRGTNSEFFTLVVAVSGHEVEAIEAIYFDDVIVFLDANGYVQTEPWLTDRKDTKQGISEGVVGTNSFTLGAAYIPGTPVRVVQYNGLEFGAQVEQASSVTGTTVTWSQDLPGTCQINYQAQGGTSKARVRKFLGATGQNLSTVLKPMFPAGFIKDTDRFAGIACLVVDLEYDPDAYPNGVPSISALVFGAKILDPASGFVQATNNPALIARDWSIYQYGGNLPLTSVNNTAVMRAANTCLTAATFTSPSGSRSRPVYTAGIAIKLGEGSPTGALDEIVEAMAGRHGYSGGVLQLRAGEYRAPVATIDEDWLSGVEAINIIPEPPADEAVNIIKPTIADEAQKFQVLPAPEVRAEPYILADGRDLPSEQQYAAITDIDHAQHVAAVQLRDSRSGLTVSLPCNMRAFALELFDVVNVSLVRYGWVNKTFEIVNWRFGLLGGIVLTLKETAAAIYEVNAGFSDSDLTPNTALPSPFAVPLITGFALASGTAWLLKQTDGTVTSRLHVSWNPITDAAVVTEGRIEIRWGLAGTVESTWTSFEVPGGDSAVNIDDVRDGAVYVVKLRARNTLVRGKWTDLKAEKIVGKTARPPDVTGLSVTVSDSGVLVKADRNPEADRDVFEVHNETAWSDLTSPVYAGDADRVLLPRPAAGTYYFAVKHRDSSGNYSLNAALGSVVVNALPGGGATATWTTLSGIPANLASLVGSEAILNSLLQPSITALITAVSNLGSDNILSPGEKPAAVQAYNVIIADQAGIDAQATVYSITTEKTAYDNAVAALTSYLGTLNGWNIIPGLDVAISSNTFSQKFADVYTTQRTLLLKIQSALKALSDAAQTAANNAATAASNAQSSANSALNQITDITSDNLLTVDEKPAIIQDTNVIALEQAGIDAQAVNYGVTTQKTTYDTAVSALATYLSTLTTPYLWSSLSGNTTIVGTTFRGKFQDVYVARQAVLDAVSAAAKARLGALATRNTVGTPQIDPSAATELFYYQDQSTIQGTNSEVTIALFSIYSATNATIELMSSYKALNSYANGNYALLEANDSVSNSNLISYPGYTIAFLGYLPSNTTNTLHLYLWKSIIQISAGQTINFRIKLRWNTFSNPVDVCKILEHVTQANLIKR
jgi:hypothetical protein